MEYNLEKIRQSMIENISIVVPAYNEEGAVGDQISEIHDVMRESGWVYEIIVINDGSTDNTLEEIKKYDVRLINFPQNRGYGASLKAGIKEAKYPYVCITDADG